MFPGIQQISKKQPHGQGLGRVVTVNGRVLLSSSTREVFQDENNSVWVNQQGEKREKPAMVQIAIFRQSKGRNAAI